MSNPSESSPNSWEEMIANLQGEALHKELLRSLRKMVFEMISQLQAASTSQQPIAALPISMVRAEELDMDVEASPGMSAEKAPQNKTIPIARFHNISFIIPEDCIANAIDMNQLPNVDGTIPERQLSFAERLVGWTIERMERIETGKREWFYHHQDGKRMLRSTIEVVRFMLYEKYPRDRTKEMDRNLAAEALIAMIQEKSEEEKEREKKEVEQFLKESHENLMNRDN